MQMDVKQLTSLVENFTWEDKELLIFPLERELEKGNIEIISQIEKWIANESIEYLSKINGAINHIAENGSSVAIPLLLEIERTLSSKIDIHEVIESMKHAVPPNENCYFYHADEIVNDDYLDAIATLFYEDLQRITDYVLKNGVNDIPNMTDDIIFAENMISPLMDAWLRKPTPSIKCKLQEACWEAEHCDIDDWLKRRAEMLRNEGIEILAGIDEKLFITNDSGKYVKT